ncbi:DUF2141 domain-containing protein [Psychroserpens jangbogonensis]|uniref:DUF2141 domain-containing protein n=1 Tax=Psychroserpens jangbogonensis TaxID=1484460 RepID=UPI00053D3778|nr:DUF2141 domain-containing protein [Psychroserpens jangbogonensis]
MKTLLLSIAFVFISTLGFSQDTETQDGQTITITVSNLKNSNGKVTLALHNGDTFMKADGIQNAESNITFGKATITFTNVEPGEYAVLVLHDENENEKMDFDANGMPQEAYGTSGITNRFGPPSYNDAKFNLDNEDLELSIKL